jgi:hypothetical protein
MAALPLIQFGACSTGINQVLGNTLNLMPAITYNAAQSTFLLPFQVGLAALTGGFGSFNIGSPVTTGGTGGTGGGGGGI